MESIRKYLNDDNINDRQKINGILKDILSGDLIKVNMLMMAYDINIAKMLYEKGYTQGLFDACIDSMVNKCGFRENFAKNIVGAWCKLLEIDEIVEKNAYSITKNNNIVEHKQYFATKSKYCFLRHFNNNYPLELVREVNKIFFMTELDVNNIYGRKVEFDENSECDLKVDIINNELYLYTNAQKYIIPDSEDEIGFFSNFKYITSIDGLNNIDISYNKNLNHMFYNCKSLNTLDISKWNVSNVENMSSMFQHCQMLNNIDIAKWVVRNVKDMNRMFYLCNCMRDIDVSKWDVKNVKNTSLMFYHCYNLEKLDVSKWDVRNINDMSYMFQNCINLKFLDLSKWKINSDTNKKDIFDNCKSLMNASKKINNNSILNNEYKNFDYDKSYHYYGGGSDQL